MALLMSEKQHTELFSVVSGEDQFQSNQAILVLTDLTSAPIKQFYCNYLDQERLDSSP